MWGSKITSEARSPWLSAESPGPLGFRAEALVSLVYSLLRALLDVLATSHGDQARLQAEVLALRRQVQVLERQIKRVQLDAG